MLFFLHKVKNRIIVCAPALFIRPRDQIWYTDAITIPRMFTSYGMNLFNFGRFIQSELFSFQTIGIDISDASFHFVKTHRHFFKKPTIENAGKVEIPEGIVRFGEIQKEKELADLLRVALTRASVGTDHFVVASLPEEKAFIKIIQMPHIENKEEFENAIRFEAETNIPLAASEMYFDYEDVSPEKTGHRDIVMIAYPKPLVDSFVRTFTMAGFHIAALELESQSAVRALVDVAKEHDQTLIIDIGKTKSGFSVFSDHTIVFTSTLPIGGQDFEKAIEAALSVSRTEAEKIKKETGFSKKERFGKVYEALRPFVSAIADETKKNIEFHETHQLHTHTDSKTISRILLCGGDSRLIGLPEELHAATRIPAEYGTPLRFFSPLSGHKKPLTEHDDLSFTTALGLALRTQTSFQNRASSIKN